MIHEDSCTSIHYLKIDCREKNIEKMYVEDVPRKVSSEVVSVKLSLSGEKALSSMKHEAGKWSKVD